MGFIYFNLVIAVITFVLLELAEVDITHKFKLRYPNIKIPKTSWAGKIVSVLRDLIGSLIPIINLFLLWVLVFHYSELEDKTIRKTYEKCLLWEDKK